MQWRTQMEVVNHKCHNYSGTVSASSDLNDRKKYSEKHEFSLARNLYFCFCVNFHFQHKVTEEFHVPLCYVASCSTNIRPQNWEFSLFSFALCFDTSSPWLCLLWACGQLWSSPALVWGSEKVHNPGAPSCPLPQPPASFLSWSLSLDHRQMGPRGARLVCGVAAGCPHPPAPRLTRLEPDLTYSFQNCH